MAVTRLEQAEGLGTDRHLEGTCERPMFCSALSVRRSWDGTYDSIDFLWVDSIALEGEGWCVLDTVLGSPGAYVRVGLRERTEEEGEVASRACMLAMLF